MSSTRLFCGDEEPHEGHGWSRISLDGQSFEMHDCYGLPPGYYDEIDKEDCAPTQTQAQVQEDEVAELPTGISMRILRKVREGVSKLSA